MKNALMGGLITQGILEVMFVMGALFIGRRHKALPTVNRPTILIIVM